MADQFSRTRLVLGDEGIERLKAARVAVFGIGGVGGYTVEALARSGVGALDLIDNDTVSLSNINRQIYALHSTIGRQKTEVAKERIADICPDTRVTVYNTFFMPENSGEFDFSKYDYVVDAVDTVSAKLEIIRLSKLAGVPVISSMGAGNKLDASRFRVTDISKTSVCPLAKVMRLELRKRGIKGVKAVWSDEIPIKPDEQKTEEARENKARRAVPGSLAFVPSAAGLLIAGEVVRDLCGV
ncbi:MAG: tRNA threonylcarbamoyladenosine dehydratase [Ruminococcus sp.]|nr:tRNA threonylcarbamoyladenosine dehydratase [Ruminococcus sp.]